MTWLMSWVKGVVVLVVLAGIVDLALPGKELRKYGQLVMGLVVMLMLLQPIVQVLKRNVDLGALLSRSEYESIEMESAAQARALGSTQDNAVAQVFKEQVSAQISADVARLTGCETKEISLTLAPGEVGRITSLRVVIGAEKTAISSGDTESWTADQLRSYLAATYGLNQADISISER